MGKRRMPDRRGAKRLFRVEVREADGWKSVGSGVDQRRADRLSQDWAQRGYAVRTFVEQAEG